MLLALSALLVAGLAAGAGPSGAPLRAWTHEALGAVWARPVVDARGRIFVGAEDGFFHAFAPGGRLLWTYKASHGFGGWPLALGGTGARFELAVGNRNGKLYVFSDAGELRGTVPLEGPAAGPPARLGPLLLVPTTAGRLVAVRGRELVWSHPTGSPVTGWPVTAPGARVAYAGCADGGVIAIDQRGRRLWRTSLGAAVASGLVPLRRGLLAATTAGEVVSLDERGEVRWRQRLEPTESGLVALGRGAVLAGLSGKLVALDERARVLWRFEADGPIRSLPSVTGDRILFGTERGSVYVVHRQGRPLGLVQAGGPVRGGIALAAGRVIFGAQDRRLYVLPDPSSPSHREPRPWLQALPGAARAELLWRRDLSGPVARGIAVGAGGRLIAATHGKRVFLLEASGQIHWTYSCGEDIDTLPAAGLAGELYFGCGDGGVYALRPDGEMRYRFPVGKGLSSSPALARDGTLYFGAADKRIYALDAAGKPRWRILTGDEIESAPRIASDGMVYVGSDDRHLYAVSPLGHVTWYHRTDGAVRSQPAVGRDGTVHVTSFDQQLHAVSAEGASRWTYQTDGQILSSPVLGADGTIYFGSRDHHLYAVAADGKLRWRFQTGGEVDSDPALTAAGEVAFGSDDGNVYVLSPEGALRWWFPAGAEVRGAVQARADGSLVFGTMAGAVMAIARSGRSGVARPVDVLARVSMGRGRVGPAVARADGSIVVAGADGVVRALGADRWPAWSVRVSDSSLGQPLVGPGGLLFVSDGSGQLAALDEGQLRFRLRLDRQRLSDPELLVASQQAGGPVVLVGSAAGRVFAVTPTGAVRWFHSGAWPVTAAPAAFADGSRRVAVAQSPELVILDEAGQQTAAIRTSAGIRAGPTRIGPLVVCGDGRGQLVAFGSDGVRRWQRDLGSGIRTLRAVPEDASAAALTEDGRLWRLAADGELLGAASGGAPYVAVGAGAGVDLLVIQADHSLWQLEGRTGRKRRLLELPAATTALLRNERGPGNSVVVTADGQLTWREFGR